MTWLKSLRDTVTAVGFVGSAIMLAPTGQVFAQSNPTSTIAVASRTGAVPPLTLQQPAALHVGGVLANPEDEFDHKNQFITGAMLSNGALVVVDKFKVRFYDKSGRQTAVLGSVAGAGPNEFRSLWRICTTRGDTVIVHDSPNARVSVLTSTGQLVRQFPASGVTFARMRCLDDGTFLVHRAQGDSAGYSMVDYLRRRSDGTDVNTVGTFPFGTQVLAPTPYVATARGQEIVIADPVSRDIRVRDVKGALVRTYRLSEQPSTVSAQVAENSTLFAALGVKVEQASATSSTSSVAWPLFRRLEIDTDRSIWLQDMTLKATDAQSWTRINLNGAVTGRLALPPMFVPATKERTEVVSFSNNGVLLLFRDSDGAVHFRYHLIQSASR